MEYFMKTIKTATLTILMTCAAMPAWGMDDNLSVIPYSTATPEQQQVAATLMSNEFCKVLGNPLEQINLLLDGDAAAGALTYRDEPYNEKKARSIEYFVIDKKHRGKDYGRFLMQKTQEDAQKLGIQLIIVEAKSNAIGFYNKIGFTSLQQNTRTMYKDLQSSSDSSSQGSL
jgi:ribosomal protein S18 acetylase RimI-like enzyme